MLATTVRTDNRPKVCFSAALGEEPEVEVALPQRRDARCEVSVLLLEEGRGKDG